MIHIDLFEISVYKCKNIFNTLCISINCVQTANPIFQVQYQFKMNKIAIVSLALLALTKVWKSHNYSIVFRTIYPKLAHFQLTFGTIVPLKDGSGTQIGQLEDEIGDALLALVRLQGQFQGGLRDGQFKSSWLVARTVNETIEMLNTVANLTQTLLQHSQFQQYRTITSAIRIVHNTSTRLVLELERALPVISAGGKFDVRARSKLTSVKETIDVSYKLIKQYFEVMITKSWAINLANTWSNCRILVSVVFLNVN